jgi:4-hydroxy-3-polyprenylbenzoate decarboxylase
MDMVRSLKERLKQFQGLPPTEVETGPIQENILRGDDVDLYKFPVPRWFEGDGGRYIGTCDMVITKDRDKGWVNLGTYRIQVHDRNTAGIWITPGKQGRLMAERYFAQGESCPVAICCGQNPTLWVASTQPLPWGISEYEYAGWIKGQPVEVVRGVTTGLPVPADAEIILEGEILPPQVEQRMEGPFAEWEGYYASGATMAPVVRIHSIMHRDNPILTGLNRIRPQGQLYNYLFRAAQIWDQLEKCGVSDIRGVWKMDGGEKLIFVISLEQRYPGHAQRAALVALGGAAGDPGTRILVLVDEDIDVTSTKEVLWAIATRCDPEHDIEILRDSWGDKVDPVTIIRGDGTTSRAIIYACRPFSRIHDYPPVVSVSEELEQGIRAKWPEVFLPTS